MILFHVFVDEVLDDTTSSTATIEDTGDDRSAGEISLLFVWFLKIKLQSRKTILDLTLQLLRKTPQRENVVSTLNCLQLLNIVASASSHSHQANSCPFLDPLHAAISGKDSRFSLSIHHSPTDMLSLRVECEGRVSETDCGPLRNPFMIFFAMVDL